MAKPRAQLPPPLRARAWTFLLVESRPTATPSPSGHTIDVTRGDDDFYPLAVAASYLGEHRTFNGILMLNMRQKRGLNYGDYAYVENFIQDGWSTFPAAQPFRAASSTSRSGCARCRRPAQALPSARPSTKPTSSFARAFRPRASKPRGRSCSTTSTCGPRTASRRLGYAIDAAIYGKDVIAELKARLPKMTKADVDRAVRKHLSTKNLVVAVVGDKLQDPGRGAGRRQAHPHRLRHQGHARGRGQGRQDHRGLPPARFFIPPQDRFRK
jgi:zinc protease